MTSRALPGAVRRPSTSPLGAVVTGLTALAVGWWLLAAGATGWWLALGLLAVLAWLGAGVAGVLGWSRPAAAAAATAALAGALAGAATSGNTMIPAVLALLMVLGDELIPLWIGLTVAAVAAGLIGVGAVLVPINSIALLSMVGAAGLGALGGYNRRQSRRNQRQAAELAEQALAAREQDARTAVARDLHDVLAHTLGGLVIQLDAAEALLEAGRVEAATDRVTHARALAGAGLDEARQAVVALRRPAAPDDGRGADPDASVDAGRLRASIAGLAAEHRRLGGTVTCAEQGVATWVPRPVATAMDRAVREALSNARRHAPGQPVTIELAWTTGGIGLLVDNPLPDAAPATVLDGGYGLRGMAERFAALPDGGGVDCGIVDGRFVVQARAALAPASVPVPGRAPASAPVPGRMPTR